MINTDAARILDLNGTITPEAVKTAFRKAAKTYHPDINPAGAEMMKLINEAFETLCDFAGDLDVEDTGQDYPEALNDALNAIIGLAGLDIEICGSWIWVGGDTKPHRKTLKGAGFKWASKKEKWNFRPLGWRSKSRGRTSMEDIRQNYGSTRPGYQARAQLA